MPMCSCVHMYVCEGPITTNTHTRGPSNASTSAICRSAAIWHSTRRWHLPQQRQQPPTGEQVLSWVPCPPWWTWQCWVYSWTQ